MADEKAKKKQPKGDKEKQFDVSINVIHDNREGVSRPLQKTQRYSFATEQEALDFAAQLGMPE